VTDRRSDGQTVRRTESIMAKTALCIASYADALSKIGSRRPAYQPFVYEHTLIQSSVSIKVHDVD